MVEAEVERDGRTTIARRFYLSSAPLDAKLFARAVRAHWGIENRLHWVMDVVFHDDLMRLRTDHGPANMATIKHAALNLIRAIPDTASLTVRRKTATWDDDYLLKAIARQQHEPSKRFPCLGIAQRAGQAWSRAARRASGALVDGFAEPRDVADREGGERPACDHAAGQLVDR